ncbi:glycoside hydrolase family 31 protein [Pengzhenrongella frigida]|uniref:Glycoside hydrolase n=1 Tax=Pengzhenrongella frigida TaxID=1259133 RepID=A0A4Q5N785_9MICO|nr:glycoside hydrolase family 31 protein [Cellulomonas sp. HLT2-17]RYV52967.1 glycoside hydrolase [Cellulomonas sp. HLT2-17]
MPLIDASPSQADPLAVVQGDGFRITVLTSRLLRLEHSGAPNGGAITPDGAFTDEPTQLVVRRRFDVPAFTVAETDDTLELWTEHLHLRYDKGPFSGAGLAVSMRVRSQGAHRTTWHHGDPVDWQDGRQSNLGGTARTLDDVDGAVALEPGLLSRHGYAVVDDSTSVRLTDDGWFAPRAGGAQDLYFFGYGSDFAGALRDFFRLTGPSPLLPRWALGNWWSRYHRYSADEYLALMDTFADRGIPLSVAVLDMDWHLVDIDPSLGSGWTGYTWDPEVFADPAAFLADLHDRDLRVTLNVHPADGVRRHEDAYADVARDLGLDPADGLEIAFDITSREFVRAYLTRLHHPHEQIGVDFWWLDWQSGTHSRVAGLDPLWMLNRVHHDDAARAGRRPLILSRYAGLGSHRYPVGFSGDTVATWASLDFQPYFTATAANVGYFWWSHDIGGHLGGARDVELTTRWFQLGVFSPVNRLHSTISPFNSKEPWRFGAEAERTMAAFLRLRHQLVPYLYTAMWVARTEGIAPVRPMYHDHPGAGGAYEVPNQFLFGPDLLVAPITTPVDRRSHRGQVTAWLPEGTWFDFFTGRRYDGDRWLNLHRTVAEMPVLARAGAVVPLAADPTADAGANPEALVLRVFPRADGGCVLLEDDGRGDPAVADRQETAITATWHDDAVDGLRAVLRIAPPTGPGVATRRTLTVELVGVSGVRNARVVAGPTEADVHVVAAGPVGTVAVGTVGSVGTISTVVEVGTVDLTAGLELVVEGVRLAGPDVVAHVFALLDDAEIAYDDKARAMAAMDAATPTARLSALHALDLPGNLFGALLELISATAEP